MLASPQIKTVKPPNKKPGISDRSFFFCVGIALNFSSFGRNCVTTFPLPGLCPTQRPLCDVGRLVRKKKRARGARWEGEREKRGLCHIICGSLTGFAVLWSWLNQPTNWTLLRAFVNTTPQGNQCSISHFLATNLGAQED